MAPNRSSTRASTRARSTRAPAPPRTTAAAMGLATRPTFRCRRAAGPTSSSHWSRTWSRRSRASGGLVCSAGYDAHRDDPLANCELDDAAYGDMAATMRDLAAELEVPVLICLEGGYSLGALSRSVVATLEAFGADREPRMAPAEAADEYRQRLARFWPALGGSS